MGGKGEEGEWGEEMRQKLFFIWRVSPWIMQKLIEKWGPTRVEHFMMHYLQVHTMLSESRFQARALSISNDLF